MLRLLDARSRSYVEIQPARAGLLRVCAPAGAKFETFLYADRILGLDLPSEIGQPRA
jgi:hypothetical protein